MPVGEAAGHVAHPRAAVEEQEFQPARAAVVAVQRPQNAEDDLATAAVEDEVAREFRDDERGVRTLGLPEAQRFPQRHDLPAGGADLREIRDGQEVGGRRHGKENRASWGGRAPPRAPPRARCPRRQRRRAGPGAGKDHGRIISSG